MKDIQTSRAAIKINDVEVCQIDFPSESEGLAFRLHVGNEVRKGIFTKGFIHTLPVSADECSPVLGYSIGPGNTYQQAWVAVLAGHQIRQPDWPTDMSWVFERNHQELLRVYGDTMKDWKRTGAIVLPTGSHQLYCDWIVLPIVDLESPTV